MLNMTVKWKVHDLLKEADTSVYAFWKESGLAKRTAYRVAALEPESVPAITADTLDATIKALRELTGKPVDIPDVLEYQESEV